MGPGSRGDESPPAARPQVHWHGLRAAMNQKTWFTRFGFWSQRFQPLAVTDKPQPLPMQAAFAAPSTGTLSEVRRSLPHAVEGRRRALAIEGAGRDGTLRLQGRPQFIIDSPRINRTIVLITESTYARGTPHLPGCEDEFWVETQAFFSSKFVPSGSHSVGGFPR